MTRGRRGAAPALKILQGRGNGTDSGGRKVQQIPFDRTPPRKPAGMSPIASKHWDHVVSELGPLRILTPAHLGMLEVLCETYARWKEAEAIVREEGVVITVFGEAGPITRKHPAVAVAEGARRDYLRMCGEFGLTPSAENRVSPKEPDDDDEANPFE